tara:strand:- start:773 stop:1987 length:1215 start_codon:yes stop_codon:yes gene_type:complete
METDKYIEIIHMFLDTGIDPNIYNSKGHTPLYSAVCVEDYDLSKKLIEAGANPEGIDDETYEVLKDKDDTGLLLYTPLSTACESVNLDIIKLLLDAGADPNKNYTGETNISWIIAGIDQSDSIDALKLLLDTGANPNDGKPIVELITLLEISFLEVYEKKVIIEMTKLLLDGGASLNIHTQILNIPCEKGEIEMVELLLSKGANPNRKDYYNGHLPLIMAVSYEHIDIVKLLLESGADPNLQDDGGWTAIMVAVEGKLNIISLLLVAGADPYIKNKGGMNAFTINKNPFYRSFIESYLESRNLSQNTGQRLAISKSLNPRLGNDSALDHLRESSIMQNISDRIPDYNDRYSQDVHKRIMLEDQEQQENERIADYLNSLEKSGGKHRKKHKTKKKKKLKRYTYPR